MPRFNRPAVLAAGVVILALAIGLPLAFARGGDGTRSSADRSPSASDAPSPSPSATDPASAAPPAPSVPPTATASAGASPARPSTSPTSGSTPARSTCAIGDGTLTVCPASGPVGTEVTLSSDQLCGASTPSGVVAVFLGPQAYVGSGGGGSQVPGPYQAKGHGFTVTYRIPASYQTSGGQSAAVGPGAVTFATYPAGLCSVPFTVTAR